MDDIILRKVTNHRLVLTEMIKLYIRLRNSILAHYFGVVLYLPPKIIVNISLIDKKVKTSYRWNL